MVRLESPPLRLAGESIPSTSQYQNSFLNHRFSRIVSNSDTQETLMMSVTIVLIRAHVEGWEAIRVVCSGPTMPCRIGFKDNCVVDLRELPQTVHLVEYKVSLQAELSSSGIHLKEDGDWSPRMRYSTVPFCHTM